MKNLLNHRQPPLPVPSILPGLKKTKNAGTGTKWGRPRFQGFHSSHINTNEAIIIFRGSVTLDLLEPDAQRGVHPHLSLFAVQTYPFFRRAWMKLMSHYKSNAICWPWTRQAEEHETKATILPATSQRREETKYPRNRQGQRFLFFLCLTMIPSPPRGLICKQQMMIPIREIRKWLQD